jgi:soluble lytic murein transglycosylase-like protein
MQIMPATARSEYGIEPQLLWDPRVNVRLGIHFLRRLVASYGGRTDRALAHYNGGTAAAAVPLSRTYPETRDYVRRVLRLEGGYRQASGGVTAWTPPTHGLRFSGPASARH